MNLTCRHQGRSAVMLLLIVIVAWAMLATTVSAAELVPPRPLPHQPTGGTLNIAYFREISSPDGFQATGSFDRMYFYAGNEVLVAMARIACTTLPNPSPTPTTFWTMASAIASTCAKACSSRGDMAR